MPDETKAIDAVGNRNPVPRNNRVTETIEPGGNTSQYGFDAAGNQIAVTDGTGQTTTTLYDGVGNATQVTDPLGHSTQYQFDADGR